MPTTKPNYTLSAHLLHSGLQMIWKRLVIRIDMDHIALMTENIELFDQVSKAMDRKYGIKSERPDYGQAAYMLLETFQQREPLYHWSVVYPDEKNRTSYVTSTDDGLSFINIDPKVRMTEDEARRILSAIIGHHPKVHMYLEKRYWKDF